MSNFGSREFEGQNPSLEFETQDLSGSEDLVMERILENINTTPIGQLLKRIASLPEVRQKKILGVRRQLTGGDYDVGDRLNVALDKVLEDLTA